MAKRAVLIGCNYPGTKAELKGCINDVRRMHRCLLDRYGFPAENIAVLIDTEGPPAAQPTGRNIRAALSDLVAAAKPGDALFVHYSGHGTRLPAESDDTGYDECIVPTDMNLITDDDFRELVDKVPEGCRITIVSDSCHSGGLIDDAKEQIGESSKQALGFKNFLCRSVEEVINSHQRRRHPHQEEEEGNYKGQGYFKSKSLPLSILIELLKQKTGSDDVDAGNLRPTLVHIFGNDATPKVKKFVKAIMAKLQSYDHKEDGLLGKVGGLAIQFLQQKLDETSKKPLPDSGILISGCQSDETSADASPSGDTSGAYGALSNAIQEIIAEAGAGVSNREVVVRARKLLRRQGFTQRPGLYCSDDHVDAPFVC